MTPRTLIAVGAILGAVGVVAGAFGAHGLASTLSPERLDVYETAVRYHLVHAVAMILTGVISLTLPVAHIAIAGYLFLTGTILFSGSLYLLVLTNTPWLGAVTPFGGVALIVGWIFLALGAWRGLS